MNQLFKTRHGSDHGGVFDPIWTDKPKMTDKEMADYLTTKGYGYRKSIMELHFGQPFRTLDEIHEFIDYKTNKLRETGSGRVNAREGGSARLYETETDSDFDADLFAYSVEERIIKTKRYDYPYYLPHNLRIAIFIIVTG
jgi:hypothetical protein